MFATYATYASLYTLLLSSPAWAQYHHASTAYEGALRGEADYIRSEGEAQYWYSLAAKSYADAYAQQLRNYEDRIARRQEIKTMNRAYRNAGRSRLTKEEATRFAHALGPQKLSDEQIDRATGEVHWPRILGEARYASLRQQIETLLAAKYNGIGATDDEVNEQIDRMSRELLASLKANLHRYRKANDFIAAKKFVEGLIREGESGSA